MKNILSYWKLDIVVIIAISALLFVYWISQSRNNLKGTIFFSCAMLIFVLCSLSPLSVLQHYLFSAHMIVHVLLILLAGPCLLLSLPVGIRQKLSGIFGYLKRNPLIGWFTGVGLMWFWHVPLIFRYTMSGMHGIDFASNLLPFLESFSLVAGGLVFSAPVIHPDKVFRVEPLAGVVYLFTACICCSLLGILITFAPVGIYHHYLAMHDMVGFNQLIRDHWQISEATDQQAAGLVMWVPCCMIYVTGALYLLAEYFGTTESKAMLT